MPTVLSRKPGGGGGSSGVSSLEGLSGAVTLSAGDGITITPTGQDIEISSSGVVLFSQTLASPAATIDTGANGIAGGFRVLEAYMLIRTTAATVQSSATVTVNNDTGANYDRERLGAQNAGSISGGAAGGSNWSFFCHGDLGVANYATLVTITIPFYTNTAYNKIGAGTDAIADDAAGEQQTCQYSLGWRNTAAITRMAVTAGSGNLMTGSQLLVLGR